MRSRFLVSSIVASLAAVISVGSAPVPARAECGSPDTWPRFREGAASAPLVVAGTVRSTALDANRDLPRRVRSFRLDVDEVLRGRAPASLPVEGIGTIRGCTSRGIQVRDGDRIVVAFGPARTGIPGPVASVAYLQPVRNRRVQPRMERLSLAQARQTLELPAADLVFFSADDGIHGRELWWTDPVTGATRQVRDIRRDGGSDPRDLAPVDGLLFFSADDGIHGRELWVTDGTALGTRMVADLRPGRRGSNPRWMTGNGWIATFSADDGTHGRELWGWSESWPDYRDPELLANLRRDADRARGSDPRWVLEANGSIVFSADAGSAGRELWRFGQYDQPRRVRVDLDPGAASSDPRDLLEPWPDRHFGRVYLTATSAATGRELYVGDWRADGLVADIAPGPSGSDPQALTATARHLFFTADDGAGRQLWVTGWPAISGDTALVGNETIRRDEVATMDARRLTAFAPADPAVQRFAGPARLDRDRVVFGAHDAADGGQLYVSDGTAAGTTRLTQVEGGLDALAALGHRGRVFSVVRGPGAEGAELWVTDGTPEGTRPVADIDPAGDAAPHGLVGHRGRLVFVADDGRTGDEPWVSDGLPGGTRRLLDIRRGPRGSDPRDLTALTWPRVPGDRAPSR